MKTFNNRVKSRRDELGLTQLQLAKKVGVSSVTISQWESGDYSPKGKNLYKLADALECSPNWLILGEEKQTKPLSNAEWAGGLETWGSDSPLHDDEVEVPFYMDVELAAGAGICEVREYHGPKLRFAKSTLKKQGVSIDAAACVKVNGNSMEPVLPHGSTVGVDTASTNIIDGKMYAINHDGMLRVKMLYRLPGGGMRLRSYNTDEWPDEHISHDQVQQVKVIGKVFWYSVLI
ncbi:S24 family peptidase [Shewanella acanthi]|uniref:S24 family peptidase n=1 Tax=Shewanella acanthi TaxID=2864212 RepID=UPI001C65FE71|nr:helix-turn-helix transcriptional regulator [Shewanella acanthi]QYJ79407.1 helix-turn-helix transcriptional regulator [Shewanella acanthi]